MAKFGLVLDVISDHAGLWAEFEIKEGQKVEEAEPEGKKVVF